MQVVLWLVIVSQGTLKQQVIFYSSVFIKFFKNQMLYFQ